MSKTKLKLTASEATRYYSYLSEVLEHVTNPDSVPLRIIMLNVVRVVEKLHAKQLLQQPVNMKLAEEHALALQYIMAVYPCPELWVYTANVVRLVQAQLPPLFTDATHQAPLQLEAGPQMIENDGQ